MKLIPTLILLLSLTPLCQGEIKDGAYTLAITFKDKSTIYMKGTLKKTDNRFKFVHIPKNSKPENLEEGEFPELVFSGKTDGKKVTLWSSDIDKGKQVIPILEGEVSKDDKSVAKGKITFLENGKEQLQGNWGLYTEEQIGALDKAKEKGNAAAPEDIPAGMEKLGLTAEQAKKINDWMKKNPKADPQEAATHLKKILTKEQFADLLKAAGQ